MDKRKLAKRLIFLIFLILFLNFFANKLYWYSSIWYFDMIMHFLGGFWVGLLYIYLFLPVDFSKNTVFKLLLFTLIVGILWELFEMLVNEVISSNPFDFLDTTSDIFFDLAGGGTAVSYFFKRIMLQLK